MNNLAKALLFAVILAIGFVVVIVMMNPEEPGESGTDIGAPLIVDKGPKEGSTKPVENAPRATPVSIGGTVRSDEGKPLGGVTVTAFAVSGSSGAPQLEQRAQIVTTASGAVEFPELMPDRYRFTARLAGFQDSVIDRTLASGQSPEPLSFVMGNGLSISGYVRDVAGAGIAGAQVVAFLERVEQDSDLIEQLIKLTELESIQREEGIVAVSDSTGYYQLSGLEASKYDLRTLAAGFAPAGRRYVMAGSTDVNFNLTLGGMLAGHVTSNIDGAPIPNARLSIYPRANPDQGIVQVVLMRIRPPVAQAETDADGAFVFDQLGGAEEFRMIVEASGHQPVEYPTVVVLPGQDVQDFSVRLDAGNVIQGVVYDPARNPLPGARVKVNLVGTTASTPRPVLDEGIETDESGRFLYDTLEDGDYRIVVSHPDYASEQRSKVHPNTGEQIFELKDGAAISGVVTDLASGAVIPGAEVTVKDMAGVDKKGTSDSAGRYSIRGIAVVQKRTTKASAEAEGYARISNQDINVVEGRFTEGVDFGLERNASVSGVVIGPNGAPVSKARLNVKRQRDPQVPVAVTVGGPIVTGPDGRFKIDNVAPGTQGYLSGIHSDYLDSESAYFDIAPGEAITGLQLVMREGGTIVAVVTDESGRPVENAMVGVLENQAIDVPIEALTKTERTSAAGRVEIKSVDPGEVTLVCEVRGYLRADSGPVVVVEGTKTQEVALVLTKGATLSGYITSTLGEPVAKAVVTAIDTADGLRKIEKRTDSTGFYQFDNLGRYPVDLTVEAPLYSKLRMNEVPVNTTDNNYTLMRLGSLSGVVRNQHGQPVSSFSVAPRFVAEGSRTQARVSPKTFNQPDGLIDFKGIEPGEYTIVVGSPGYAPITLDQVFVQEDQTTDLGQVVLLEGGRVAGYVIDAETGEPIFGATVGVEARDAFVDDPMQIRSNGGRRDSRTPQRGRKRTDRDGYFELDGLATNSIQVKIEHRNYMPLTLELQVGVMDHQLALSRGGIIEGTVRYPDGRAREQVHLFLTGNGRNDRQISDRKGSFTFSGLPDGIYTIRISNIFAIKTDARGEKPVSQNVEIRGGQAQFLEMIYDGPEPEQKGNQRGADKEGGKPR